MTGRSGVLAVAALVAVATVVPTGAAEFEARRGDGGELIYSLTGPILPTDGAMFRAALINGVPDVVEIEGPGGDFLSAVRIGVTIKDHGIRTHATGRCFSSCAYIWIAGSQMLADEDASIDIHLPEVGASADSGEQQWLDRALLGWYLGRLDLSIEMMEAFLIEATDFGRVSNRSFDMLAFAREWNAPVMVIPGAESPAVTAER